jgi:diaminohydroxyphosphoribosylaminopyrimidine deaminase/5-amino-6-(5-phosphoribosylamino)uracil reductase
MRLALVEARRALGRTFPNPPVGAVVHRGDRVLGRGHTQPPGGAHAEAQALARAERRYGRAALRGATLTVTLEPCCTRGRTGPCTDLVVASGVRRVQVGHVDPHRDVSGRGLRQLRRAGLEVRVGILEAECRAQHRGFVSVCERGRPFVTLKLAASLDGRIATASGESRWISGAAARAAVHRLRAASDAVAVGSGTALADDPELTARRGGRVVWRPIRVLFDSRLRVPPGVRMLASGAERTWVLCARDAAARRKRAVAATGARLLEVAGRAGHLDLRAALRRLAREGLTQVLVEGGGELAAALLREDLVDELHWFVSPRLLGSDGRAALGALGAGSLAHHPRVEDVRVRRAGDDLHLCGVPRRGAAGR